METAIAIPASISEALKKADRIDRRFRLDTEDGRKLEVWKDHSYIGCAVKYIDISSSYHIQRTVSMERFADIIGEHANIITLPDENHKPTISDMVDIICELIDADELIPDCDDEDDYGRPLNTGTKTSLIESEEDDFYLSFEVEVSASYYYRPATYWEPEESETTIKSVKVYGVTAGYLDEDENETPLSDSELAELKKMLDKEIPALVG